MRQNVMFRGLILMMTLLFVWPLGGVSAAPIKAGIKHTAPEGAYIPGFRINLDVEVANPEGVEAVRCYFKTRSDQNSAFVTLTPAEGNLFTATLPAPFVGSEAVDYCFLVVDKDKNVTRTKFFSISEGETDENEEWQDKEEVKEVRLDQMRDSVEDIARLYEKVKGDYIKKLPSYQSAEQQGVLEVAREVPANQAPMNGFYDNVLIKEVPAADKFGFAAEGLYTPETVAAAGGAGVSGATSAGIVSAGAAGLSTTAIVGAGAALAGGAAVAASGSGGSSDHHDSGQEITSSTGWQDLVGTYTMTTVDPPISYDEWHAVQTLRSDKTFDASEYNYGNLVNSGTGTWDYDSASRHFSFRVNPKPGYQGAQGAQGGGYISGRTDNFTLDVTTAGGKKERWRYVRQ